MVWTGCGDVRNPGLRALLKAAGFADRVPDAGEVGFRIAPAINASGRMDSAGQAVRMFLTSDAEEADRIARELFALNQERQTAERSIVKEIFERCVETPVTDRDAALVLWGEGWHRGVVGIVASRVVERFHRPAIVLGVENGVAQGSGRSIEAFHLARRAGEHARAVHEVRRACACGGADAAGIVAGCVPGAAVRVGGGAADGGGYAADGGGGCGG